MTTLTQDLQEKYKRLSVFEKIIAINVTIYIIGWLVFAFNGNIPRAFSLDWLALPHHISDLLTKPWAIVTYAFAHVGFWHLVMNMLVLYFVGRSFSNLFKERMALSIYVMGFLAGAIAYYLVAILLGDAIINNSRGLLGASAAIRGCLLFLAFYMPDYEVRILRFNIKLVYIAYVLIAFDLIGLIGTNAGGNVSHLGGDFVGFFYAKQLQKGKDIGEGIQRFIERLSNLFSGNKNSLKTVHRNKKSYAGHSKKEFGDYNKQKQIDLILDKISKSGYESLTAEEKEFLFKAGKD